MKDVNQKKLIWRFAGFCTVSLLYGFLAVGFVFLVPTFDDLFKGFGLDLNWFSRALIERPWLFAFPAVILPSVQLVFLVGITWGSWPQVAYTRISKASVSFLVLLFIAAAFVLYGNIFKLRDRK